MAESVSRSRPTSDHEAEQHYLSCALLEPDVLRRYPLELRQMSSMAFRTLLEGCHHVHEVGELNLVTLRSWLIDRGRMAQVGEDVFLGLTSVIPMVQQVEHWHARIVSLSRERSLASMLTEAASNATQGRYDDALRAATLALEESRRTERSWLSDLWHPVGIDWLTVEPPAQRWILKRDGVPVLASGIVGMLIAPGGRGKSMALLDLAIAVATGRQWLGSFDVVNTGRAAILLAEEDALEARRRLYQITRALGLSEAEQRRVGQRVTVLGLAGHVVSLIDPDPAGRISPSAFHGTLLDRVRDHEMVILDPLSRFAPMIESDNAAATAGVTCLEQLAQASGGTVLVAHHTSKWSRREGSKAGSSSARGVTALTDGVRWVASLTGETEHDLALSVDKSNRAPPLKEPVALVRGEGGALRPPSSLDRDMARAAAAATAARTEASALDEVRGAVLTTLRGQPGRGTTALRQAVRALGVKARTDAIDTAIAELLTEDEIEDRGDASGHRYFIKEVLS